MFIDKMKQALGLSKVDSVLAIYKDARNEKEALVLLRAAKKRDEDKRREIQKILQNLTWQEQEYMNEGRKEETSQHRKLFIAREVKILRHQIELETRKLKIIDDRLRVTNEHIATIETIHELKSEPIPEAARVESTAVKAKALLADLDDHYEVAQAIGTRRLAFESRTSDVADILKEFNELRQQSEERKERECKKAEKEQAKEAKPKQTEKSKEGKFVDDDTDLEWF